MARSRAVSSVSRRQLEGRGGGARRRVAEHRQHVGLGVPEAVPVVAGAGQALGADRPALAAGAGLQGVEEGEADRLLQLGVAVEFDVGALPEVVEVLALGAGQRLPAGVAGLGDGAADLVADRRLRALRRPAVGEELDDPQLLPRLDRARHRQPPELVPGLDRVEAGAVGPFDQVVHRRRRGQAAAFRRVDEDRLEVARRSASSQRSGASSAAAARGSLEAGGCGSLVTSSDWTTNLVVSSSGSTS